MLKRPILVVAVVCGLAAGVARATSHSCTPGAPFPVGPLTGTTTCNRATGQCEAGAASALYKAMCGVMVCHHKEAAAAVSGRTLKAPEETCEDTALTKLGAAIAKGQSRDGAQCGCVDPTGLQDNLEGFLDSFNGLVYCSPGVPIDPGGDDSGSVATHDEVAEHNRLSECLCTFGRQEMNCQRHAAQHASSGLSPFDEAGCEATAQARYAACTAKLVHLAACNDVTTMGAIVGFQLASYGSTIFCSASPSGAFLVR